MIPTFTFAMGPFYRGKCVLVTFQHLPALAIAVWEQVLTGAS